MIKAKFTKNACQGNIEFNLMLDSNAFCETWILNNLILLFFIESSFKIMKYIRFLLRKIEGTINKIKGGKYNDPIDPRNNAAANIKQGSTIVA